VTVCARCTSDHKVTCWPHERIFAALRWVNSARVKREGVALGASLPHGAGTPRRTVGVARGALRRHPKGQGPPILPDLGLKP